MIILLDTNILTRLVDSGHPMHRITADAVNTLRRQGDVLQIVPQNIYEFWAVCTRPITQNGLGLTPSQTQTELVNLKGLFPLLSDTPALLPQWELLVTQYQVSGKNAHDARLVAAMMVHGVSRILTFNVGDFQRYQTITVLDPQQVLAPPPPTP